MKIKLNYKGKKIILDRVGRCDNFLSQTFGLMFRKDYRPLLFNFKKPVSISIHSFFVRTKFLAVWLLNGVIVDVKPVRPWTFSVRPKSKFDMLLEIPFKSENEIVQFLDDSQKI